jgi:WD40 repeat protein
LSAAAGEACLFWPVVSSSNDGLPARRIGPYANAVTCLSVSADGTLVITGHENGTVTLRSLQDHTSPATFGGPSDPVRAVALSRNGRILSAGHGNGQVDRWDVKTNTLLAGVPGQRFGFTPTAISEDAGLALTSDAGIILHDLNAQSKRVFGSPVDSRVLGLSADSKIAFAIDPAGVLFLYDTQAGARLARVAAPPNDSITCAAADAHSAVYGTDRGDLVLVALPLGTPVATLSGHRGRVNGIHLLSEDRLALTWGDDGTVRLWDLEGRQQLRVAWHRSAPVKHLACRSDHGAFAIGEEGATWLQYVLVERRRRTTLVPLHNAPESGETPLGVR